MKRLYVPTLVVALLLGYSVSSISQTYWKLQTNPATAPCGRLTLTSGTPVTTADVTGATTIRYTPYVCDTIPLWDGTIWQNVTFTETSQNLGTLSSGKPYDVFGFISSGALALEFLVWTNDTTRATAVAFTEGRLTKSGDKTRLLLGTFYTTSTTATEDSAAKRYLSNVYNTRPRTMVAPSETTDSWTYTTATYRQANANTANQLNYVSATNDSQVKATVQVMAGSDTNTGAHLSAGVGVDSTSTNSAQFHGITAPATVAQTAVHVVAQYVGFPGVGRHALVWLEYSQALGTSRWYGDAGNPTPFQSGIFGEVWN